MNNKASMKAQKRTILQLQKERVEMKARIAALEAELVIERKLFHIARIVRLRKIEDEDAYVKKMLLLDIEQLDELASITEQTFDTKPASREGRQLPGVF